MCPFGKSQLKTSPLAEEAGRDNFSMGGTTSDSDSGSGSESSANTDSQLESLTGPEFIRRNRPAFHLRRTHLWFRRIRLIWSRILLVSERLIYAWKETKKQINQPRINLNEQPVRKKKVLRFPRDFLYKAIYSSWYRNKNSNIIKLILHERGVKTNYTYALKLLDQGEGIFFSKLNQFYSEYIKGGLSLSKKNCVIWLIESPLKLI